MHNKPIETDLEAWLTFLSEDRPEKIIELIAAYPVFQGMYESLYRMCQNTEKVMGFFSEELKILDRNTVQYMIDEQQKEIEEQQKRIVEQLERMEAQQMQMEKQQIQIEKQKKHMEEQQKQIEERKIQVE